MPKAEQYCLCETRHKTQEQQVKQIAIHSGKNTKLFPSKIPYSQYKLLLSSVFTHCKLYFYAMLVCFYEKKEWIL